MNNWQTKELNETGVIVLDGDRGRNYPSQDDLNEKGDCLFLSALNVTKSGFKFNDLLYVTKKKDAELGKGKISSGDLVLTTRGTVGNIAHYSQAVRFENIRINSGMAILRNVGTDLMTSYIIKYFESPLFKRELNRIIFGSAQPQLTIKAIKKIPITVPPVHEQKRIVAVLEIWDEYLEFLDQKIALKEQLKKGLMQQLLTGKKRLPGFTDNWKKYDIGELLSYEQPGKYIVKSTDYTTDGIPVLTANKSFILGYTQEVEGVYKNRNVIIFDDFTMASKYVHFDFKIKSSAIKILSASSNKVNIKFVYERMQLISTTIGEHKRNYISEYQFNAIAIPTTDEQNMIVRITNVIDNETSILKTKRNLIFSQKKYLLKNLISGTIRTPENLIIPKDKEHLV